MKKITYFNEAANETNRVFFDLPDCFGCEYLIETSGNTLTEDDFDSIEDVEKIIAEATSEIMEATEADMAYVMELAENWGIA